MEWIYSSCMIAIPAIAGLRVHRSLSRSGMYKERGYPGVNVSTGRLGISLAAIHGCLVSTGLLCCWYLIGPGRFSCVCMCVLDKCMTN